MLKLISPLTQVDSTTAQFTVGSKTITANGNEYIYLPGTDSVAQYNWVAYRTSAAGPSYGSVTRMTQATSGPVGIAQGAITSNKYGWFGISGVFIGLCGSATAAGGTVYASGTAAAVNNEFVAGQNIFGAISTDIGKASSGGTGTFILSQPFQIGVAV